MIYLLLHRVLKLPRSFLLLNRLRRIDRYWSREMVLNFIKTLGAKLPQDELCVPRLPDSYAPKVEVEPACRLSEEEIREFYQNGFLKPFKVWEEEEMAEFGERLLARRSEVNSVYGFVADRDRHLEMPEMMRMITHPAITERMAQLLGPNLITWRSQIFYKPPGAGPVGWHQASTYMFEEGFEEPLLFPPDKSKLFMLTVWIPTDPATYENGCMKFVKGSLLNGIQWMRLGGDIGFHAVKYYPDYKVDPDSVLYAPMKRGEALIFSERTIHGSDANVSDGNRLAFNFRIVEPETEVYPGNKKFHRSAQMGHIYDMSKWKAVIVRGEDTTGLNKAVPWQQYA